MDWALLTAAALGIVPASWIRVRIDLLDVRGQIGAERRNLWFLIESGRDYGVARTGRGATIGCDEMALTTGILLRFGDLERTGSLKSSTYRSR